MCWAQREMFYFNKFQKKKHLKSTHIFIIRFYSKPLRELKKNKEIVRDYVIINKKISNWNRI